MKYIGNDSGHDPYNTWKLICINAVTAGLEIVSSVVFTIVPPLLLKFGYSETQMSLLFGVGKKIFGLFSTNTLSRIKFMRLLSEHSNM